MSKEKGQLLNTADYQQITMGVPGVNVLTGVETSPAGVVYSAIITLEPAQFTATLLPGSGDGDTSWDNTGTDFTGQLPTRMTGITMVSGTIICFIAE